VKDAGESFSHLHGFFERLRQFVFSPSILLKILSRLLGADSVFRRIRLIVSLRGNSKALDLERTMINFDTMSAGHRRCLIKAQSSFRRPFIDCRRCWSESRPQDSLSRHRAFSQAYRWRQSIAISRRRCLQLLVLRARQGRPILRLKRR
jgi:hypothetical protein